MARFEFRLEALLTHRQQIEKEKQRRVAQIQQEIQALMRQIQDAENRIRAENRTLGVKELTGRLDMHYIANEKRFVGALTMRIALTMQRAAAMEQTLAEARRDLLAGARARKVIEKLKERQLARWRQEQERKEAALMDEIGTQWAVRAGSGAEEPPEMVETLSEGNG
jgi:flagellar protein FliJ